VPEKKLKDLIRSLVLSKKLIGIGAILLAFSCFLPWYSDIDRFNTGSLYLGVSGPLYLAGLVTFISASASIFVIATELLGHKIRRFPLSSQQIHIFAISISILMVLLSSSVYFHPKFGINIANKSVGVGMLISILSITLMLVGVIVAIKKKLDKEDLLQKHEESLNTFERDRLPIKVNQPLNLNENVEDERFSYFSNELGANNNKEN